jgi:hypothetical protein
MLCPRCGAEMVPGYIYGGEGMSLTYLVEPVTDPPRFEGAQKLGARVGLLGRPHMETYRCNACRIQAIVEATADPTSAKAAAPQSAERG